MSPGPAPVAEVTEARPSRGELGGQGVGRPGVQPSVIKEASSLGDVPVERVVYFGHLARQFLSPEMDGFCLESVVTLAFFIPPFKMHHSNKGSLELLVY